MGYNLSYAGFSVNSASDAVNYPIDKVYAGNTASDSPLTSKIINTSTKQTYRSYIKFLADYIAEYAETDITNVVNLIDSLINTDPTKHSTYAEFIKGITTLKQFSADRNKSIYAQLAGTQNTSSYGNISTSVNLNDMGSMVTGAGGGRPGWN